MGEVVRRSRRRPSHAFAQNVSRTGSSDLYSTWVIPRHGRYPTPQEYATALLALADWVETGVRPTWPTAP